jgi:PTS system D-glucosamine-specific IIC component/PTS system maltose and glucose-specific IIC component
MNQVIATTLGLIGATDESPVLNIFGMSFDGMLTPVLGISDTLQMGVFGGMIAGSITVILHNKYNNVKLPDFLGFFGGARFVPIISSFAALFYGMALEFIWPFIGGALSAVGTSLGVLVEKDLGFLASLLFGLIERSLIPFGLHHVFYLPLWQTSVGGIYTIDGTTIEGTQNAFFAALAANDYSQFPATNFMSGKFPFMMFGLPAAAYAMYVSCDQENKKEVGGMLLSVAFTAFLTGITEPIEFTFLFIAPVLYYFIHVPLAGISFMLMDLLNVKIGMTFSGGFIDYLLFGILPGVGGAENGWIWVIPVGIVYGFIYYGAFRFAIVKFDLATPGRGGADNKLMNKKEYNDAKNSDGNTDKIIEALGGAKNIDSVDACITRLRVSVLDSSLVRNNDYWVKELSAKGLVINGNAIQAIYGQQAATHKININDKLGLD